MPVITRTRGDAAQAQRLGRVLPHWLGQVPLYRAAAALLRRPDGPGLDLGQFHRLPLITKEDIQ